MYNKLGNDNYILPYYILDYSLNVFEVKLYVI